MQLSFLRFLIVGGMGLTSDIISLYNLRHFIPLIWAKVFSYMIALIVTWLLNRRFTFQTQRSIRVSECTRYACIYLSTGVLHVGIFAFLVHHSHHFYRHPIWAVLITAFVIAFINFFLLRLLVYNKRNSPCVESLDFVV